MGLFEKPTIEKRISKSGKEIEEKISYAHKAYEFLRNIDINQFNHNNFATFNECNFKADFAKFILNENNISKILEIERATPGFIAKCYNNFEKVQATHTSNKGNQHQLKPTVEKFVNYFNDNKFSNVEDMKDLALYLGEYYDSQETFELAKKIIKLQKQQKVKSNITNKNVIEQKLERA